MNASAVGIPESGRETPETVLEDGDFRAFLAAASDWFWKTDADLRVTFVSHSFFEQTGMPLEQPVGRPLADLLGEDALTQAGRSLLRTIAERRPFRDFVRSFRNTNGQLRHVRINGVPAFDAENAFLGYRGSGCDATAEHLALQAAEQARAALVRSEYELRAILENIADGVVTIDANGRIESCNRATLRMFGYREDELRGRNVSLLIPEPERNRHDSYIRRYIETGQGSIINIGPREVKAVRKDGSVFPIDLAVGEVAFGGRRVFVGTLRDITRRTRNAEELAANRQSLADAQRIARFGNWTLDLQTGEVHWSDELYRLMGLTPGSCPASVDLSLQTTHPDDRDMVRNNLETLIAGPERFTSFDYRMIPEGAAERIVHGEFRVIVDRNDVPVRVVGTAHDVTEARRMAMRLVRSERQLARAQRISGIGSWELDIATGEMHWSEGLYALLDLDPGEQSPSLELFYSLVHPEDIGRVRLRNAALFAGESRQGHFDWRMKALNGSERFFHAEIDAEDDDAGQVRRVTGTVQDVTSLRAAEKTLQEALAAANEASRSKSEFLANMSHELRTPLNAIIGFSEFLLIDLKKDNYNQKLKEYLKYIYSSGEHLLEIINDILNMSRTEENQFELTEERFALSEIVDWVARLMSETAKAQGVDLVIDVEDNLPDMLGEARLIRQALLNLVSNAIKFTPPGGLVKISAEWTDQGDFGVVISDSGLGMKQEDIPIALTPFGQVESTLTRKFGGTGLGLPLAKKFIELHKGELTIESVPLQGTTIRVVIPRSRCRTTA